MAASWNIDKNKTQKLKNHISKLAFLSIYDFSLKEAEVSSKCKLQILLCYKIVKHAI